MFGYKSGIRFKDLIFISYAGMIRGAVAFGLVLRINNSVANRSVIVTTSLALVVVTTVFMGSTVATVQYCLFGKEMAAKEKAEKEAKGVHHGNPDDSHHEVVEHPNFEDVNGEPQASPQQSGKRQGCGQIMKRLDLMIIKPLLIYNYEKGSHKKQKLFNDLLMLEGEKLEEIFTNKMQGGDKHIQLIDYLNQKAGGVTGSEAHRKSHHSFINDPERSVRLDSERSGQIELQSQPAPTPVNFQLSPNPNHYTGPTTTIVGAETKSQSQRQSQPYSSIYSEGDKLNSKAPLIDNKNPYGN